MAVTDKLELDDMAGYESSTATARLPQENKKTLSREEWSRSFTNEQRELLRDYINRNCIKRVPPDSKELPAMEGGGRHYIWQFYLRSAVLIPKHLNFIANHFWSLFLPRFRQAPFQIAGVEQASVPILTAILLRGAGLGVPAFTIRKQRKLYGIRNLIEGRFHPSLPVVFLDDLTSPQHSAFWHAVYALSSHGLKLYPYGFVLVRKQEKKDPALINTSIGDTVIESIFTLDDFVLSYEDYSKLSV
jgi:orotate phosphoribosyltransferase